MSKNAETNPWDDFKKRTAARIGLRRSGGSIGTQEWLRFRYDHAKARDAVWGHCDFEMLITSLQTNWNVFPLVSSKAKTREEYLLRPDFGRRLDDSSIQALTVVAQNEKKIDVAICIADGLSPLAINQNIIPFLASLHSDLNQHFKKIIIVCVENGRVAIGDEIAEILGARVVIMLIGERPGLSSVDSIGAYITYEPRLGDTDERRNCISNIRPLGLDFVKAKNKLLYLVMESIRQKISGVWLKDRMVEALPENKVVDGITE
jgi:ethanolamine ammonia-lyase small subunit